MDLLDLFWFLLGGLLFFGARLEKRSLWNGEYTSRDQTGMLRGAAALGVALHHIAQKTCAPWNPSPFIFHGLDFFVDIGYIFVSVFFFLSGLGLYKSFRSKPDYLKHFFRRRVLPVIIAFYLSEAVCLGVRLLMGERASASHILWGLSGLRLSNVNAWYMVVLPLFYLFFYLSFRLFRREGAAIAAVFLLVLGYTVGCAFVDHQDVWWVRGEWWYNSVILFPMGLLYAKHETKLTALFRRGYLLWLAAGLACVWGAWRLSGLAVGAWGYYGEQWGDRLKVLHRLGSAASQWLVCIAVVWACMLILMKCRIGNGVLKWFGKMSLDFYLMHGIFVELFGFNFLNRGPSLLYIRNVPLYLAVVLACGAAAAVLFRTARLGVMRLLPGGRRIGGAPREDKKKRLKAPADRARVKKILKWCLPVPAAAALFLGGMALFSQDPSLCTVNGVKVRIPDGFVRTFRDRDVSVWTYGGTDKRPGPMVIDTSIRGSRAQVFRRAEEVMEDCTWLGEAQILVNSHGIRFVRGYSMDYSGYPEYRIYVETSSNVFLIGMSEHPEYYNKADCESFLLETAEGITPPGGGK